MAAPTALTNQYFVPFDEEWIFRDIPMKASTAMALGVAIGVEISGNTTTGNSTLMPATNANGANFKGILAEPITASDSDYAVAGKLKKVAVPLTPESRAYFLVGAGTFTAADVNKTVSFHSDSASLAVDTAGAGASIDGYISSTKGICKFNLPNTVTA